MTHEPRCIEIPCTCVSILREKLAKVEADKSLNDRDYIAQAGELLAAENKIRSLEKKIEDGLSCCCSGCTKHNQDLQSPASTKKVEL